MRPRSPALLPLDHGAVDLERRVARVGGREVPLTAHEAELLAVLAEQPGADVPREELLGRVWGYRGTRPSRAVDIAVSRLRAKIEPDRSRPRHLLSTPGVGYRLVTALRAGGPTPPTNARAPATPLYGRDGALAELDALLGEETVLTLHGVGGIGKTRLALALLERARGDHPGGSWLVEAGALRTREDLVAALGRALGRAMPEPSAEAAEAALVAHLAERPRALFLVDDPDAIPDLAAALAAWTREAPAHRWLLTRRLPLGAAVERARAVDGLDADAAATLFGRRAGRTPAPSLLASLDGIPLALEIAGAWARSLDDAALDHALGSTEEGLWDDDPTRAERHRSVDRCVHASLRLLPEPARRLALHTSVYLGPFGLEDAEAVVGRAARASLRALVEAGLLRPVPAGWRLLVPVRLAARRLLHAAGETARAEATARAQLVRFARRVAADLRGPDPAPAFADVTARLEDLRRAQDGGDPASRVELLEALGPYLRARGPAAEILRRVREAWETAATEGWSPALRARALVAGPVGLKLVAVPSVAWVEAALPDAGDPDTRDTLLALLAVARSGEDAADGLAWLDRVLPPETPPAGPGRCEVELVRAVSAVASAPLARMEAARQRAWELADRYDCAWARARQAVAEARVGLRVAEVLARVDRAERLLTPIGDLQALVVLDCVRAVDGCLRGGDLDGAEDALARAEGRAADQGSPALLQYVARHRAHLDLARGRPDAALARVVDHYPRLWMVNEVRATAWALLGRYDDALACAHRAVPTPPARHRLEAARSVALLGAVHLLRGEPEVAAAGLDAALADADPRDPRRLWYPAAWMRVLAAPPGPEAVTWVDRLAGSGAEDIALVRGLPLLQAHAAGASAAQKARLAAGLSPDGSVLLRLQLRVQGLG